MKILITGALGHIGSSLLRHMGKNKKIKMIYLLDNMSSNRYCSLFNLPKNCSYKFLNIDLKKVSVSQIPKTDFIIHLAAKTDAAQSKEYENEFYTNNLAATKKIINYCNKTKAKLIFASSTSVYGPQSDLVDEYCDISELRPQSPYANIKLIEEKIIQKKLNKKNYYILRLGTIYGFSPGIRFHTAVNKFIFQSAQNLPLTVWKTAFNQKRPYLSLSDFNRAINHIINNRVRPNHIYNIVSLNLTVKQIVNSIKKYNNKIKIKFVNHPIMNQLSYEVSNKKFQSTRFKFLSKLDSDIKLTLKNLKGI